MKVFGIGLSKTGTTSLAGALEILGFSVKDCLGVTTYTKGDISSIDSEALATYDAFTDTPIPSFYQELDKLYPDAKFVLTVREMDAWLNSCRKQFSQKLAEKRSDATNQLFLDLYGTVIFDEEKFRAAYEAYVDGVHKYFEDRPNDLLVIDIAKGEGWEKLCPFLSKPIQTTLFPKSNVTQIKWLNVHELASNIRQITLECENSFSSILYILISFSRKRAMRLVDRKLENLVSKELTKLNANIPIISNSKHDTPLEDRNNWHHYWLIDCSREKYSVDDDDSSHIVNVALIEDGKPYIGVVYSCRDDILYYSALDKGAFKTVDHQKPMTIGTDTLNATPSSNSHFQGTSNPGYLLCQSAETEDFGGVIIEGSREWDTAAGHAILLSLGMNLRERSSDRIVKYNKDNWKNPDIEIIEQTQASR